MPLNNFDFFFNMFISKKYNQNYLFLRNSKVMYELNIYVIFYASFSKRSNIVIACLMKLSFQKIQRDSYVRKSRNFLLIYELDIGLCLFSVCKSFITFLIIYNTCDQCLYRGLERLYIVIVDLVSEFIIVCTQHTMV